VAIKYKMSLSLVQNAQVASALNAGGGGGGGGTITAVNSANGSGITAVTTAGVVALSTNLVAGAGVNLVPSADNTSIAISAQAPGNAIFKNVPLTIPLTAKVAGTGALNYFPLITINCGLTAGHTYLLNVFYDGGIDVNLGTGSNGTTSFTPFIANSADGNEDQLPYLFGFSQSSVASAPSGTSTVLPVTTGLFSVDFSPITFSLTYPALDANVYINVLVQKSGLQSTDSTTWSQWSGGAGGWTCQVVAVDCGLTPPV
jgi:hypothetical protein